MNNTQLIIIILFLLVLLIISSIFLKRQANEQDKIDDVVIYLFKELSRLYRYLFYTKVYSEKEYDKKMGNLNKCINYILDSDSTYDDLLSIFNDSEENEEEIKNE